MKKDYQGITLLTISFFLLGWFGSGSILFLKILTPIIQDFPLFIIRTIECVLGIPFALTGFWIAHKLFEISDLASQTDAVGRDLKKWENMYIECAKYCVELENKLKDAEKTAKVETSSSQQKSEHSQMDNFVDKLQAEADQLFFHESEITPEIKTKLNELGITVRILDDNDYETAVAEDFCDWLASSHSQSPKGQFYEITQYIPQLEQRDNYGRWVFDTKDEGTLENPKQAPFVRAEQITFDVVDALFNVIKKHPEFGLPDNYQAVLQENGLKWNDASMKNADVSEMDAKCILALMVGVVNADRFSDGTVVRFFNNGCMLRWMKRLENLDGKKMEHGK